ncbi:hypothetical protein [Bacillus mesophilum]|uniref:hypothetical protein n=1 Tax=Bacillus mesophilum TaxID=1071718 RepID=UPI001375E4E9|nr:hypothetical protein [Bacillus mesophilum]
MFVLFTIVLALTVVSISIYLDREDEKMAKFFNLINDFIIRIFRIDKVVDLILRKEKK